MNPCTIVIAFPGWPNETVISTWVDRPAPRLIVIDGENLTTEQKQELIDRHAEFVEEVLANIAARK